MSSPTVLVLYNEPTLPAEHPDADSEYDVLYTAEVIGRSLKAKGLVVRRLGIANDIHALIDGLRSLRPDVVFNLYEGTAVWGDTEVFVASILEWMKIPFTGSSILPMTLCRSKPLTKGVLLGAGLPTAKFSTATSSPCPPNTLGWPVIVKPASEDGSVGITQESVVTTQEQLDARAAYLLKTYGGSVLVEQFIRGREFHVSVLERDGRLDVLPFSEIVFHTEKSGHWPIISFDAKWHPGTKEFENSPAKNPADVDPELEARVSEVVRQAFRTTGCRDYCRIDLRVDDQGNIFILEVNPNPCIAPMGGLEAALISAKIPYEDFCLGLVKETLRRSSRPELAERLGDGAAELDHAPELRKPLSKVRPAKSTERERLKALMEGAADVPAAEKALVVDQLDRLVRRNKPAGSVVLVNTGGFIIVERCERNPGVVFLLGMYISPECRGQGFGRDLLAAAEEFASPNGRLLQVDLTAAGPLGAFRRFLTHHGFLQMADIPEFYPDLSSRVSFVRYLHAGHAEEPHDAAGTAESRDNLVTES